MKPFNVIFALLLTALSANGQSLRLPAEWEKQERVHLAWFGNDRRDTVLCRVVEALQPDIEIILNIPHDSLSSSIKSKLNNYKIDTSKIHFATDPNVDFWTRDPLFFVLENQQLKMVDFNYSMYGVYPEIIDTPIPDYIKSIGEYDKRLAAQLNIPTIKSDFVFEAGGIESNGKGTFLIIKEMALQRNPTKSLLEIENELTRVLGAKKIVWLKDGLIEDRIFKNFGPFYKNYFGGGANRHIDELCRFVDDHTVILPFIDKKDISKSPVDSINYYMLEENFKILKKATNAEGKKLEIHRVPMPEIEQLKYTYIIDNDTESEFKDFGFRAGDTIYRVPAASYVNYFISNNTVLIPKYWKEGMSASQKQKDQDVKELFEKLFPDRKIIQIYTLSINRGGGGIHCMTHEQPATEK
ncbi:MAG: agmatine deiminase family protein [Aequorivita sp.]|nr:agmatine deiminase family protein [Aequorivita sp.]